MNAGKYWIKKMIQNNLPELFIQRLKNILPPTLLQDTLNTFDTPFTTTFWINTLKAEPNAVLETLKKQDFNLSPIAHFKNCYQIPQEQRTLLTHSELYSSGKIYIQNLSSMLPVIVLNPQPNENILDLTAAPGSKTIQMACALANQGHIAAVEAVKSRFFQLKTNLEQYDVQNVSTYLKDGRFVWKHCPEQFDKILLDAPCSSEARFKTYDSKTFAYWSEKKIQDMSRKQKQLIYSAIQCLKPGGLLVYSTCSFAPEENELVIQHALKKFQGKIKIEAIQLPLTNIQPGLTQWKNKKLDNIVAKTLRILPTFEMSGFYICQFKKIL